MNQRRFGVEVEHFIPGTRQTTEDALRKAKLNWRSHHEYQSPGVVGHTAMESVTPILKGEKGFAELKRGLEVLKDAGAKVTTGSGTHVHHDAPEFINNKELQARLVESWANNEKYIYKFVAARRRNGSYCPRIWTKGTIDRLKASDGRYGSYYGGRGDLNLSALYEHGSIEIRLHEGTLDYDEIESWVKFGQYFLSAVIQRKRPFVCRDEADLLKRTRVPAAATRRLLAKTKPTAMVVM